MGWVVIGLFILWCIISNLPDDFINNSRVGIIFVRILTALFLLFIVAMCTMGDGGWEARWG